MYKTRERGRGPHHVTTLGGPKMVSTHQSLPLDLEDIRKEQRRLATLLDIQSRDPEFNIPKPKVRHASKNSCLICKLPAIDRKCFNDKSYVPLPDVVIPEVNSDADDDFPDTPEEDACRRYTDGAFLFGNYGPGSFKLPTLEAEIIIDDATKRIQSDKFKLPPVFDEAIYNERTKDPGRLIALSSDKTFAKINPRNAYDTFSGEFSGDSSSSFLSRVPKTPSREKQRQRRPPVRRNTISESALSPMTSYQSRGDNSYLKESASVRKGIIRRTSIQSERSYPPNFIPDFSTLRYHHRDPSDILRVPRNTPDKQFSAHGRWERYPSDIITIPGNSVDTQFLDWMIQKNVTEEGSSSDLSFELHRQGSSVYSRETTPDEIWSRIKSANICQCNVVDRSQLRCSECLKKGGHHRWCISQLEVCPVCRKVIKMPKRVLSGNRIFRSPSFTFQEVDQFRSSPFSPHPEQTGSTTVPKEQHSQGTFALDKVIPTKLKMPSAELKVRFSETKDVRTISPSVLETEFTHEHVRKQDDQEGRTKNKISKTQNSELRCAPTCDPDFHKQAYQLALKDARLKKFKREKNIESSFTNSLTGPLFSYFSKLRRPKASDSPQTIGFHDPEKVEKVKVKKGLRHILGNIKIEEYYGMDKFGKK